MFTLFFNHQGSVTLDVLPANSTIIYYTEIFLPKVVQEISSQRLITATHNVLLLHDNASPRKIRAVTQCLEGQQI